MPYEEQAPVIVLRDKDLVRAPGVYVETSPRPLGYELANFLFDGSLPVPQTGLKRDRAQLWERPLGGNSVWHLVAWLSPEQFPSPDLWAAGAGAYGLSCALPPDLDYSLLTPASRLLVASGDGFLAALPLAHLVIVEPTTVQAVAKSKTITSLLLVKTALK